MIFLLDANLVIALLDKAHEHHARAEAWLANTGQIATCPITEGAFVRYAVRQGQAPTAIQAMVTALAARTGHDFWSDDLPYARVDLSQVIGHRQVTDAYLVSLVRHRGPYARLATLDGGLAQLYPDVAVAV